MADNLVPVETYLSAGVHIGMKQRTSDMKKFVYKVRPDGLSVFDMEKVNGRIKAAANFISRFNKILVVSRKKNGKKPIEKFAEVLNSEGFEVRTIAGRFYPGTLTNPAFPDFWEPQIVLLADPLADVQALSEAVKIRVPIVALCDTFNETKNVDLIIPCNSNGRKALALIFWLMSREISLNNSKIAKPEEFAYTIEDFGDLPQEAPAEKTDVRVVEAEI